MAVRDRLNWLLILCVAQIVFFDSSSRASSSAGPSVADAGAVFAARCVKCHGADGKGVEKYKKQGQKDFTDAAWQKSRTDAQLTESINNGKGDFMPAWKGKLSADEIKGLVGYVRALGKKK
jgi:cytochrome c oxidase cbb3-type subunit 3